MLVSGSLWENSRVVGPESQVVQILLFTGLMKRPAGTPESGSTSDKAGSANDIPGSASEPRQQGWKRG